VVNGQRTKKKTTTGWDIEIEWRDGSTLWLPMKEVKATNSVELAKYAVENWIDDEPAFDWWVKPTLRYWKRLIKLSQKRHSVMGYKFGIRVPCTIDKALKLDEENGNDLWRKAIQREMEKVRVAFQLLERGAAPPPGHQFIKLHMIFDIKMDFTRKARLVAGGHMTETPTASTYSSVVMRDSVRIIFLIAALNDLDILMSNVGNAYLNASPREKVYCIFGGDDEGKIAVIVHALYGLKSSGAAWRAHFAQTLSELGFKSSLADPDVWMKPAVKADGTKYYEYILVYVDDQLSISENPKWITDALQGKPWEYELKGVKPPDLYLGATIGRGNFDGIGEMGHISARGYLEKAIPQSEEQFGPLQHLFRSKSLSTPAPPNYHPEIDETNYLDDDMTSLYQSYVGIL